MKIEIKVFYNYHQVRLIIHAWQKIYFSNVIEVNMPVFGWKYADVFFALSKFLFAIFKKHSIEIEKASKKI